MSAKSTRFPSITLDKAILIATEARKFGKNISDAHLGGKPGSGGFVRKKASLGYYSLISGRGSNLVITDLADRIINNTSEDERVKAIKEAFLSPELFKKLYESAEKKTPIKLEFLGNVLVREHGVLPAAKNTFLANFIRSGIFAGLVKHSNESKDEIILLPFDDEEGIMNETTDQFDLFEKQKKPSAQFQTVELSLSSGTAKIIVPNTLTQEDSKKLKAQINILANIFDD